MHKGCGVVILLAVILGMSFHAFAAIYKWVDKDGKVHYSDTPRDGAQLVTPNPNTENAIKFSVPKASRVQQQATTASDIQVQILSPVDQQTLRDNRGNFSVSSIVTPSTANAHVKYVLLLDGQAIGQPQQQGVFELEGIDRGQYQLKVQVIDSQNTVLASSPEITVYLHRFSKHFNQ